MALITAMCILATGSRDTIRDVLLSRSSFRSAVDDTQQWILDAVRSYADAQYGQVRALISKAIVSHIYQPSRVYNRSQLTFH